MSGDTIKHFIVFEDGAILELDRLEDAWPCARENGYTVEQLGRRWWVESHRYGPDGEPMGEEHFVVNFEESNYGH